MKLFHRTKLKNQPSPTNRIISFKTIQVSINKTFILNNFQPFYIYFLLYLKQELLKN